MKDLLNKIHHADCLEFMRQLPDKCVDLVLTDPPYEIGAKGCGLAGNRKYLTDITTAQIDKGFDSGILDELLRLSNNLIIFSSKSQISQYIAFAETKELNWQLICWHKSNPTPLTNNNYLPDTEYIFHMYTSGNLFGSYETKAKYFLSQVEKNDFLHPTVKPLQLIKKLLINGIKKGIVLDCFSGMATTALACHDLGLDFICVEKDADYHAASVKRLNQHRRQGNLFAPAKDSPEHIEGTQQDFMKFLGN